MTTANHFVMSLYADKTGFIVHLDGKTLKDAERALRWQQSGFDSDPYAIVQPVKGEPGMFRTLAGSNVKHTESRGWTDKAWGEFVARTWPE
jgi:hypothetical protein